MRNSLSAAAALLLAACGNPDDRVGGLTRDEARQLNEAAEMLDKADEPFLEAERELDAEANSVDENMLGETEGS